MTKLFLSSNGFASFGPEWLAVRARDVYPGNMCLFWSFETVVWHDEETERATRVLVSRGIPDYMQRRLNCQRSRASSMHLSDLRYLFIGITIATIESPNSLPQSWFKQDHTIMHVIMLAEPSEHVIDMWPQQFKPGRIVCALAKPDDTWVMVQRG